MKCSVRTNARKPVAPTRQNRTCISLLPRAPPTASLMLPMVLSTLPCACAKRQRCGERQIHAEVGTFVGQSAAMRAEYLNRRQRTREGSEPVMIAEC